MEKKIAADKAREAGAVRITTVKPYDNQPKILYGSTFGYDPFIAFSGIHSYERRRDVIPSGLSPTIYDFICKYTESEVV